MTAKFLRAATTKVSYILPTSIRDDEGERTVRIGRPLQYNGHLPPPISVITITLH